MYSNFIFKNIDSTDYLMVNKLPPIFKASKDIEKIEIAGKDGFLVQDLGSYRGIIKTVECTIMDLGNIDFICNWLTGNGDVIFSNETDKIYKATIINQIEFKKVAVTFHTFIIQFECQPHKYSTDNELITLTSASTIFNLGTATSNPVIKIYATGEVILNIGTQTVTLKNIAGYVTINSELMDCYKDTQLCNNLMEGSFPILEVGQNIISWVGNVNKIEVTPNFRWL